MARGLWKNSLLKILLTRSILGGVFRPLLFSPQEHVHYTFLEEIRAITAPTFKIQNLKSRGLAFYWLSDVPRTLFEELFLTDEKNQAAASHDNIIKTTDGTDLAHLTWAYIWFYIEYIVKSKDNVIAPYIEDLKSFTEYISFIFSSEKKISYYRACFTRLTLSQTETQVLEKAAGLYLRKSISCLVNTKNPDDLACLVPAFIQTTSPKCIWKLENAKYTTLTMLNHWI